MVTSAGYKVWIAREANWAQAPSTWIALPADPTSGVDVVETLFDDARRGQAVIGFRQLEGVHRTEMTIASPLYPDECGLLFRSIIGDDQFTGSTASVNALHRFDVESFATADTQSFTLAIGDDTNAQLYRHAGLMVTQMTIRFNAGEGLVTQESTVMGYGMVTTLATANITNITDTTSDPFRGWQSTITAGTISGSLISGEISIARNSDLLYVAQNSKFPLKMIPGLMEITGRMTASFDGSTQLDLYRNVTNEPVRLEWAYNSGQGATGERRLSIEFPKLSYTDSPAEIDRTGNNMTIGFNVRALLGGTTSSLGPSNTQTPIRVRLINTTNTDYDAI